MGSKRKSYKTRRFCTPEERFKKGQRLKECYEEKGIKLAWKNYTGYPEYPQLSENFTHQVSIIDLLFNVGDDAPWYIWGWRENSDIPSFICSASRDFPVG